MRYLSAVLALVYLLAETIHLLAVAMLEVTTGFLNLDPKSRLKEGRMSESQNAAMVGRRRVSVADWVRSRRLMRGRDGR